MKTTFHEFKLTSTYKGNKNWSCDSRNSNNHIITVYNTETGKYTRFEFWESIVEREIRTERQLIGAFECFLSDALTGIQNRDIDDFANEFGYTSVKECIRAWKGCTNAARKAKRVVGDESRLCDLINEINDREFAA